MKARAMRRKPHNFFPERKRKLSCVKLAGFLYLSFICWSWWATPKMQLPALVLTVVLGSAALGKCFSRWSGRRGFRVSEKGLHEVFWRREVFHPWESIGRSENASWLPEGLR